MIKVLLVLSMLTQMTVACAKRNYVDNLSAPFSLNSEEETCQYLFKKEKLCLQVSWENDPTSSDYSSLIMTFTTESDLLTPVDPTHSPFVFLWMPSMGHGSTPVTMEKISTGKYRASKIYFVMPGDWDVRFQLKSGNAIVEQHVQSISI